MRRFGIIMICLIGMTVFGMERDPKAQPLQIKGVKVSNEADAKSVAFKAYREKMPSKISAKESAQKIDIIALSYDVRDFSKKGEFIWEVRVMNDAGELLGIMWVHPNTEKAHFVRGAWEKKSVE
jgi:hypothetical protein